MASEELHRGYHDLGGSLGAPPGEPIDRSEHVLEPWEKRVDAMRVLLGDKRRQILRADGLRHAIETMGEDLYLELSYYERWMAAILKVVEGKGVVTHGEVLARVDEIKSRLGLEDVAARPMPGPGPGDSAGGAPTGDATGDRGSSSSGTGE